MRYLVLTAAALLALNTSAFAEPSGQSWRSEDGVVAVVIPEGWFEFSVKDRGPEFALFVATPNAFQNEDYAEACQVLRAETEVSAPEPQATLNADVSRYAEAYLGRHPSAVSSFSTVRGVLIFHADGPAVNRPGREVVRAFSVPLEGAFVFYILMCAQTLEPDASPARIDAFMNSFRLNVGASP